MAVPPPRRISRGPYDCSPRKEEFSPLLHDRIERRSERRHSREVLRVRVSRELDAAVRRAASKAGTTRSEWARHALEEAVRKTG
jgi:predicted HicB family RNase H-like nuclease